jgi:septum formation protein
MMIELPLILASASPRRKQLLAEAGFVFEVMPPDEHVENERLPHELPVVYVRRLAFQKAKNVADKVDRGIVLGGDTVVLCGENILEKPVDCEDARRMLHALRGEVHQVLSGLCLIRKTGGEMLIQQESAMTRLLMQRISDEEIEAYLDTGNWQGKAGAFGYQDGNDWIIVVEGSESNVVGLPMELFRAMCLAWKGGRPLGMFPVPLLDEVWIPGTISGES